MGTTRFVVAAIALIGPLAACADAQSATTTSSVSVSETVATSETVAENSPAPSALQFSAPAVGGGSIDFTQYAGQPVVLWFWAPT